VGGDKRRGMEMEEERGGGEKNESGKRRREMDYD
jgi:hypothetical protein